MTNSPPSSITTLTEWADDLVCTIDHHPLTHTEDTYRCAHCGLSAPLVTLENRSVYDFRAKEQDQAVNLSFSIPVQPLDRYEIARTMFRAPQVAKTRRLDGATLQIKTKLDPSSQLYLQQLFDQHGEHLRILDLGCGNGDNRRYLNALGFKNVLSVDWIAKGAQMLVDAHRLPFATHTFDIVVSTAVFEHLYNPFLAMQNISRVSKAQAWFLASASFWEGWHGSSYFHLTPDGWNILLTQNGYQLQDLWTGWGVIPSAFSHVFTPGYFRKFGYGLQAFIEGIYRLWGKEIGVRKLQLRASGSYVVFAAR